MAAAGAVGADIAKFGNATPAVRWLRGWINRRRKSGKVRVWGHAIGAPPRTLKGAAKGGDVIQLDVSDLEPPEPMVRIMAALERMKTGESLQAVLPRRPVYLLPILREAGHRLDLVEESEERWVLTIVKA